MSPALRLIGVAFRYGAATVLDEISLDLHRGTLAGLIGPNGVGKSTLLQICTGALRPWRGRVELDGRDIARYSSRERARRIALVPQTLTIPFSFTAREFVALGRTPYLSPLRGEQAEDRRAIDRALDLTETTDFAERNVLELSGGERQRVVLALALAQEPEVLLLDEPTANLDVAHQLALLRLIRRLNQEQGLTVLAAIHDLNLAALFVERLILLGGGKVVADGPPDAVLTPERIQAVFGAPVVTVAHPRAPVPLVALVREE